METALGAFFENRHIRQWYQLEQETPISSGNVAKIINIKPTKYILTIHVRGGSCFVNLNCFRCFFKNHYIRQWFQLEQEKPILAACGCGRAYIDVSQQQNVRSTSIVVVSDHTEAGGIFDTF